MRGVRWLGLVCGAACSVACVVKSFEVDPEPMASGGSTSGGTKANAGSTSGGTKAIAGSTSGGSTSGGTSGSSNPGDGGSDNLGGDGNVGTGAGPHRIGFSEFHDSASASDMGSSHLADATFAKPPGTAPGDLMLVLFGCDHELMNMSTDTLEPAGWTLVDQHVQQGTDGQGTYLLYRLVDGTEPDMIVFPNINNLPNGNGVQGLLSVYRGVSQTDPVNAYEVALVPEGTEDTVHIETPTPAITTKTNDCLLIAGLSPDTAVDAPAISSWPEGFDENQTSVNNPPHPYPNGWANIYTAERHLAQAGTVPASRFAWDMTYGGMSYYGALSFVLALAPAQ
jgi:hypothetical protein